MVSLFFVILIGIDVKLSFKLEKNEAIIDLYIFKNILIIKLKIFIYKDLMYYQLNRKDIKKIKLQGQGIKLASMPKIHLRKLNINISNNEVINNIVSLGVLNTLIELFLYLNDEKFKIDNYNLKFTQNKLFRINIQLTIGLNLIRIIVHLLFNLRRENAKSRRQYNKIA